MPKDAFKNYYLVKDTRADTHMRKTLLGSIVLCLALVGTFTAGRYSSNSGRELDIKGNGRNLLALTHGRTTQSGKDIIGGDVTTFDSCVITFQKGADGLKQADFAQEFPGVGFKCVIVSLEQSATLKPSSILPSNGGYSIIDIGENVLLSFDMEGGLAMKGKQLLELKPDDSFTPKGVDQKAKYFYVLRNQPEELFFTSKGKATELAKALKNSEFWPTNTIIEISQDVTTSTDKILEGISKSGYNFQFRLDDIVPIVNKFREPINDGDTVVVRLNEMVTKLETCTSNCQEKKQSIQTSADDLLKEKIPRLETSSKATEDKLAKMKTFLTEFTASLKEVPAKNPPQEDSGDFDLQIGGSKAVSYAAWIEDHKSTYSKLNRRFDVYEDEIKNLIKQRQDIEELIDIMDKRLKRAENICKPSKQQDIAEFTKFVQEHTDHIKKLRDDIAPFDQRHQDMNTLLGSLRTFKQSDIDTVVQPLGFNQS